MKLRHCCAALASLMITAGAQGATPANTLVIAQSIDDAISFDPAQGFELTTVQSFNSLYQRLLQSNPQDPVTLQPTLASAWQAGSDNRSLTFTRTQNSPAATRCAPKT